MKSITELAEAAHKLATEEVEEGYLVKMYQLVGTPFTAADREGKWYILWGDKVMMGNLTSFEECETIVYSMTEHFWTLVARYSIAANQIWVQEGAKGITEED